MKIYKFLSIAFFTEDFVKAAFGDFDDSKICDRRTYTKLLANVEFSLDDCANWCEVEAVYSEYHGVMCCHYKQSGAGKSSCAFHESDSQKDSPTATYSETTPWTGSFLFNGEIEELPDTEDTDEIAGYEYIEGGCLYGANLVLHRG